jgi:hypothetical protein
MDNHAPSFLSATRVVECEVFKPVVGPNTCFLSINIRVDIIPSIETTCRRVYSEIVIQPKLPVII